MTQEFEETLREQILQQALNLPFADRAFLAESLLKSIEPPLHPWEESAEEWSREINRRIEAYDRGEVKGMSFEESLEHLRQALAARRSQSAHQ